MAVPRSDGWVTASFLLALAGTGAGAALGSPTPFGPTALAALVLLGVGWRTTGSPRLGWLLVFGAVFGILELAVDWYHVVHVGSFAYTDHFAFRLLASPWYMPIAWCVTGAHFGYAALRAKDELGAAWEAVAAVAALGLLVPPWYEEFAAAADAWHYAAAGFWFTRVPAFVVVGYGAAMAILATAVVWLYRPRAPGRALAAAVLSAAGLFVVGFVAVSIAS